ncbi:MAG: hypothetical protein OXM61_07050 [Candidatus Poribacteria bacterium]|nr:hypothetical protein [Candidatus Poribacteria bacterium]
MISKSISIVCSIFILLNFTSCTSMKTLDLRADEAVKYWKGKHLEEFVKANPEIDVFQVVDLGGGKKRHVYRYQEPLTAQELIYGLLANPNAKLIRFIYLFVDRNGKIYDATWQRKLVE